MKDFEVEDRLLDNYKKFDLKFVKNSIIIDIILNITNRKFNIILSIANVKVNRELDIILSISNVTSSKTLVIRYSFNISFIANTNTIVRRYRLTEYL